MADTFQFDLVAPERRLASMTARSATIPGAEGDVTVMAGHAPVILSLRPGLLRIEGESETQEYIVTGGFAEIAGQSVSVLAERSLPRGEMNQEIIDRMIEDAAHEARQAKEREDHNVANDAMKVVADMVAMGSHIGLDAKQPNF